MKDYSITAIMPTCGRTKCIGESIYSFLQQTHANKKLIILDTHPQDMKFDIVLPSNIIYIKEDSNRFSNLGDKYRYLMDMVDTDLFCIWEDDDLWLPNHMEVLIDLYHQQQRADDRPLAVGYRFNYLLTGGVDKPIDTLKITGNVCWCRYLFENKGIDISKLGEPFDVLFLRLFKIIWRDDNTSPTYIYRWDNGQGHMSGLYGSMSYDQLFRKFETELSNVDISSEAIKIGWRHNYQSLCDVYFAQKHQVQ